jgi:hypothetical protein
MLAFDYPTVNLMFDYLKPLVAEQIADGKIKEVEEEEVATNYCRCYVAAKTKKDKTPVAEAKPLVVPKEFELTQSQKGLMWIWNLDPSGLSYLLIFVMP